MTFEELKNNSVFPVGGENVNFAQYFVGTSYLKWCEPVSDEDYGKLK